MFMHNYRNTYVEINSNNLFNNVKKIINKYNDYKYYIAVVKASCYGHNNLSIIQKITIQCFLKLLSGSDFLDP